MRIQPPFSSGHLTVALSRCKVQKNIELVLLRGQKKVLNRVNKVLFPGKHKAGPLDQLEGRASTLTELLLEIHRPGTGLATGAAKRGPSDLDKLKTPAAKRRK